MFVRYKHFAFAFLLLAISPLPLKQANADSGSVITRNVGSHLCGYVSRRWSLGTIVSGSFHTIAERLRLIQAELANRRTRRLRRTELARQLETLTRYHDLNASQCAALPAPRINLSRLPKLDNIVTSDGDSNAGFTATINNSVPTFKELTSRGAESLFWRPGVVDSMKAPEPTTAQCREFAGNGPEGTSAGDNGCFMTQRTALAFRSLLEGSNQLCVMQRSFADSVLDAGGAELISGVLPPTGMSGLLAPGNSTKTIKAMLRNTNSGNRDVFIRVASRNDSLEQDRLYQATLWHCVNGTVERAETITVNESGDFVDDLQVSDNIDPHRQLITCSLHLDQDGFLNFDPARPRYARVVAGSNTFFSISDIAIDDLQLLHVRSYSGFSNGSISDKSFTLSRISGDRISELQIMEGVHSSQLRYPSAPTDKREIAFSYRPPRYLATPSSPLRDELDTINFNDSFYSTRPSLNINLAGYSCSAASDVTVRFNLSNRMLRSRLKRCQDSSLEDFNYCGTPRLRIARLNWGNKCRASR